MAAPVCLVFLTFNGKFDMEKIVLGLVSAAAFATVSMAMAGGMTNLPDETTTMPVPHECADSNECSLDTNQHGFIVSGNLGYGTVDYTPASLGIPSTRLHGAAWNANLAYQFNPYFALESGFTSFHDIVLNSCQIQTSGVDLLGKGILPINEQYNVFMKVGVMNSFTKTTSAGITINRSRTVPEFGIGASYNVNERVALTLQGITTLAISGPNAGTFTMPATYAAYLGASYRFDVW